MLIGNSVYKVQYSVGRGIRILPWFSALVAVRNRNAAPQELALGTMKRFQALGVVDQSTWELLER